ncbi:MAG TPA: S46 family peptidase [Ignavibacteria bacterium]
MKTRISKFFYLLSVFTFIITVQFSYGQKVNYDTVKAGKFDLGKMWTFEHAPVDYFAETYNFRPSQEWLDNVRMSALKFANYCSASFISEDGLVLTNHHCGRESVTKVTRQGEDLHKTGFNSITLADERKVDSLWVEQLIKISDVTKEVQNAIDQGKTENEKIEMKMKKVTEIEQKNAGDKKSKFEVVTLYNGAEYMLYEYRIYDDVRLVFAPENDLGFFGGDPDNFTYPRYDLDCTFFRVYDDNGQPLKTSNYFKWSKGGANEGEAIFVVGNPGSTERLNTLSQLEFKRDVLLPVYLNYIQNELDNYAKEINGDPELQKKYDDDIFSLLNSQKAFIGTLKGLNDPYLMAKKKDFEKTLKAKVEANSNLKEKYGSAWAEIEKLQNEKKIIFASFPAMDRVKLKLINQKETYYKSLLGKAIYEVYGTSIPPDATFTLRISDGVISSYQYNGTTAPPKTTFYGLYDRHYSFNKKYPFELPDRWLNPPPEFDLSTPMNFAATNDITGGNSGSPVINTNGEIVGLAFDGNIESLPGDFIFTTESNRMICVDSEGLLEAVKDLYKAKRLSDEMENGKLVP